MYLDEERDALFLGAMDRVFRLNLSNISHSHCEKDSLLLEPTNVANCVSKGKSEHFDCRNHIRVLQPVDDGRRLYVCGTNAHSPRDWVINWNLTHLNRQQFVPGVGQGAAKCPYDPADNSTALWVRDGNPGGLPGLYSGTNAEFTKADTVIFRSDLHNMTTGRKEYTFKRTLKYDSKWLDKPNFVGSFDVGDYVLFFFRETAVEYINCGKAVYSRVARVCKRDTGGKNILAHNWATYLKARLNCSLPGEFPFYFNEIQSVYRAADDPSRFYGVFTTSSYGLTGSAICGFTLHDIQEAFRGKFKEQATSTSAWLPVLSSKVPEPRPGECVNNTESLPDTVLNFIRSHPLMDSAVAHEHGRPVFYTRESTFTRLAVHAVRQGSDPHRLYRVFYAGTAGGQVYKVVQWGGGGQSSLLDVWEVTPGDAVRLLELSERHQSLYVASDSRVMQIGLAQCARRHTSCVRCVRDPYCGWDSEARSCKPSGAADDLLQDVAGEQPRLCDASVARKQLTVTWGQSVHVSCYAAPPPAHRVPGAAAAAAAAAAPPPLVWTHRDQPVALRPDRVVETASRGLVILGVTEQDAGRYDCLLDGRLLCSYNVTVSTARCGAPGRPQDYHRVYADWCHQLNKHKAAMLAWEQRQAQCGVKHNESVLRSNEISPFA
ncbi:hypothetical protein ONE63_002537 [Megalurothrips usitatus]|uniref:Semaphorin-2A n=1 Tax=Megalurothrips usitatus TaxID=439358 RepID=A0AAV7XCB3_9NEOP|nr:hypothetical protein ONE63_002537 [Megalurothrips usitatus]